MKSLSLAALISALAVSAHAEVTVVRHFRLGEADAGAVAGVAAGATSTDSEESENLTLSGSPVYSADVANGHSTLSMDFNGTTQFATTGNWNNLTTNFGVEVWVKPTVPDGEHYIIYNGKSAENGWGILQNPFTGKFGALFGGRATFGSGDAIPGVWTHLAIVCTDTVATFYVNGVPSGTTTTLPLSATGLIGIGTNAVLEGRDLFGGKIDEVRVFTFAPGAFSVDDLLFNGPPQPPVLNLTRMDITDTLSWPSADRGFGLETTTDLLSNTWTPVYSPSEVGGTFSITRTSADPARFYRLKKPCGVIAPPMLPEGKFIRITTNGATKNVTTPSSQQGNRLTGNTACSFDATAFIDPADCNGGAGSLDFHWVISYPGTASLPNPYSCKGITGYRKATLTAIANSFVNQPLPFTANGPGAQFQLTVTSRLTGLSTVVDFRAQIISSSLTLTIFNDCLNRLAACPNGECSCTIAAALPTPEDL